MAKHRPDHWSSLAGNPAYRSLFESEDSPLVTELNKQRKVLFEGAETDPHALGLARGVQRFAQLVAPDRLEYLTKEDEPEQDEENPLTGRFPRARLTGTRNR